MKVAQLIEALQAMPQDLEVVTHANNHHTSHGDGMRVAVLRRSGQFDHVPSFVCIGNWTSYHLPHDNGCGAFQLPTGPIYAVRNYGESIGQLIQERPLRKPSFIGNSYELERA
jgi:hypothetical protein